MIPWDDIEDKYASLFSSKTGMPAKPLRMALGSLMIQKQCGYSDRERLEQITENPYYQSFIGCFFLTSNIFDDSITNFM